MARLTIATLTLLVLAGFAATNARETCDAFARSAAKISVAKATAEEPPKTDLSEEVQKKYRKIAEAVWARLIKKAKIVPGQNWPENLDTTPVFEVVEAMKFEEWTKNNAAASLLEDEREKLVKKDGKFVPLVRITYDYIHLYGGSDDAIAQVLGHELGHHALGHTIPGRKPRSPAQANMESHRREADADLYGARLMLSAGFDLREGAKAMWKGADAAGMIYSSAAATCLSHPGRTDRIARLFAMLDRNEEQMWRYMSAFENGVTFLQVHNYGAAEQCFLRVTKQFPKCYEAWANLGLARLLRYRDGLSAEDIRLLGVGHFLGSAYPTAGSIGATRGGRMDLWNDAIKALMTARGLKPGSPLVLANLALAHTIHPAGKDVGTALQYLTEAETAFEKSTDLPDSVRMELLIDFAVIHLADRETEKARKMLAAAIDLAQTRVYGKVENWPLNFQGAVRFNTAVAMKETNQRKAAEEFETFLKLTPRSNPWWVAAYEQYETLCKVGSITAKAKNALGNSTALREQQVIPLKNGSYVHVGQSIDEALEALGEFDDGTPIPGTDVRRLQFKSHGLYVVADSDEVFAIVITSASATSIRLQESGASGKVLGEIRVGMTRKDVKGLPGRANPARMGFLAKDEKGNYCDYDYYADLGVAVVYDSGVVIGILVGKLHSSS